jgi:multidrug efflux system outer membrane protein
MKNFSSTILKSCWRDVAASRQSAADLKFSRKPAFCRKPLLFICGSSIPFALAIFLAGCAVGPDYKRPAALPIQPLPKKFSADAYANTNQTIWKIAAPAADQPRGEWWQSFNDSELNRLETLALTNNQNLAATVARFEQSRASLAGTRADFYPQLTLGGTPNGDLTRQRTSINQPQQGVASGTSHTYNTFTAPIYLGWEIDLWGRVRRQAEAAKDRFVASMDDYESARLAVAAEVATDYFALRTLNNEFTLVTNTIDAYRRSLELTQNRRRGGVASDLDVAQAATQLHSAEAQLPDIKLSRAKTLHALAILCGESPVNFTVVTDAAKDTTVPEIPPSLPSELLEHRPDIAAAERHMAAANADVGVAKAAFFPTVRINGLAGFQSVDASTWFDWPSRFWSVGPSVQLPLFTGGLNRSHLALAHAAYDEMVADYRQTVLSAFGEVEDGLAAQQLLAEQWNAENETVIAARRTLEIASNRYKSGLVTYLDVASAQADALLHERNLVQLEGTRLTASVNLVKALGCGWQATDK